MLEPHSLVDGVVSPTSSVTTFSDERIAVGENSSIDLGIKKSRKIELTENILFQSKILNSNPIKKIWAHKIT